MSLTTAFARLLDAVVDPNFIPVPSLDTTLINPVPSTSKRQQQTFINPLTGKVNVNSYKNRYRVNKDIEAHNTKINNNIATIAAIRQSNANIENKTQIIAKKEFSNHGKIGVRNFDSSSLTNFYAWIKSLQSKIPLDSVWKLANIVLYWTRGGEVINRTMTIQDFYNYNDFLDRYSFIKSGGDTDPKSGSDQAQGIDQPDAIFIPNQTILWFFRESGANASPEKAIFNIHGINLKGKNKKNCINKSLEVIEFATDIKILTIDNLIKHIKENKLPIRVVSNLLSRLSPKPNKQPLVIKDKNFKCLALFNLATECNYEINELYSPTDGNFLHTLVYCPVDKHVDVILDNDLTICDNIYSNPFNDVYKMTDGVYNKIYTISQQFKYSSDPKEIMRVLYVCFDYETVIDWDHDNIMKPYSLSWFWFSHDQMGVHLLDENKLIEYYRDTKNRRSHIGFDCSEHFLKWILENENNTIMRFVGFNSANFDNFLLFTAIMDYRMTVNRDDFSISDLLYNGNQLLAFKLNGRHTPYDVRKHLVGSLASNCESFRVPAEFSKISGFSHDEIQRLYNIDKAKFIENIKDNEEITNYNDNDVLCLGYIFAKYYKALTSIDPIKFSFLNDESFATYGTIGGVIMKIAESHWKSIDIELPKLNIKQYTDVLRCKTAGRVDLFLNDVKKLESEIASLDVCSLYPYIMAIYPCYFPCGKLVETDTFKPEKIGFYYCDVDQRSLKSHNLPNILPYKQMRTTKNRDGTVNETNDCLENKWDSDQVIINVLISNVTIELLQKHAIHGVTVNVKNGFYFTGKIRSIDMFRFLMPLMQEKNKQDTLKKNESAIYNPAMREACKLLMNSISGKVIEGLHCDQVKMLTDSQELIKINSKYGLNAINSVGNAVFVSYIKPEEELINKQRPVYIGAMIYEYARRYMYEKAYSAFGLSSCKYTDTDAIKIQITDIPAWQLTHGNKQVEHWPDVVQYDPRYTGHKLFDPNSKIFGSYENELKKNNVSYFLQKKTWLCANIENGKPTYIKYRFKGVSPNSYLLNGDEPFIGINDKEGLEIISEDEAVFTWCMENKNKQIGDSDVDKKGGVVKNQIELFDRVLNNGFAYVLCCNIQRVVKNSRRNVSVDEEERFNKLNNHVKARYMIKKIKLN